MFNRNQKKAIESSKSIYIVGRGPTANYVKYGKKNILYIGFRNKIKNGINLEKKDVLKSTNRIKIGSIYFGLYSILNEIELCLKKKSIKKKIFLFGFDFRKYSTDEDFQKKPVNKPILQQIVDIGTQNFAYQNIKKRFKNLIIYKCGFDFYSDLNPKNLNYNYNKEKNKIEIVAEITTNHQGNTERLSRLIEGAIDAGCKIIKFQKRNVESFYPKSLLKKKYYTPISSNFYEYRKKLELNKEQLDLIKYYKKSNNLEVIFSALDIESYKLLKKEGFDYFKIPSTISNHIKFIDFMSKQNLKKLVLSTGMTNQKYIDFILRKFAKVKKLYLLHAISSYPTSYNNLNLDVIKYYKTLSNKKKNIIPGYSSHDPGYYGCMLAVAAGALMIEKHIKLGKSDWMHYDDTALDVIYEFPNFIDNVNKSFICLGSSKKKVLNVEHHKYNFKKYKNS